MTSIYITEWQKKNASIQTNSKWMYYKHEYCTLYFGMRMWKFIYIDCVPKKFDTNIYNKKNKNWLWCALKLVYNIHMYGMYLIHVKAD